MKVVFMGTPVFSVSVLEGLINEGYEVVGVVTQPDKKVGRKQELRPTPIKEVAIKYDIPVFQPIKIKEDYQDILDLNPDIIITAAYGQFIPKVVLDYPKYGCINVHGSLLPKLRGGAPIHKSITEGHEKTGITIMYMAEKMDAGDMITKREVIIENADTVGSLHDKLSITGKELLLDTLPKIISGDINPVKQEDSEVTYAYNIKREEELVNWDGSKEEIYNHVRGFNPWPVAYTLINGKVLKLWWVDIHDCPNAVKHHTHNENGEIIKIFEDAIGVKVKDGVIKLKEVQLQGKKRMKIKDLLNGNKELFKVGNILGR